jgi:hypothetical protein
MLHASTNSDAQNDIPAQRAAYSGECNRRPLEDGAGRAVTPTAQILTLPRSPSKRSRMTHGWSEMKRACFKSAEYRLDIRLSLKSAGNTLKKRMSLGDKMAF